jgi:hypothetical protein
MLNFFIVENIMYDLKKHTNLILPFNLYFNLFYLRSFIHFVLISQFIFVIEVFINYGFIVIM